MLKKIEQMLKGFPNINTMKDIFEKIYEDAKHNDYTFLSYFKFFDQYGIQYEIGFPPSFFKFSKADPSAEKFELRAIPLKKTKKRVYYPITNCGINHEEGLIITPVLRESALKEIYDLDNINETLEENYLRQLQCFRF